MSADSPIVEEVRRRRDEISRQYDDDLRKYGEHLREVQQQHRDRVVDQITVVKGRGSQGPRHKSGKDDSSGR
jgi:hypothetical protein